MKKNSPLNAGGGGQRMAVAGGGGQRMAVPAAGTERKRRENVGEFLSFVFEKKMFSKKILPIKIFFPSNTGVGRTMTTKIGEDGTEEEDHSG